MNKEQTVEIDLLQVVRSLLDNVRYIILATVIFGLMGFAGSTLFLRPTYEATAKMIVNTPKNENQVITSDQLNSAKNLVDTYAIIICSRDVLNQVIVQLNLPENYNELLNCVSVHAVNDTQIMEVVVRHENPAVACAVAEKILELTPDVIVEAVDAGSVKTVEQAYVDPDPVSPGIVKNAVLTAFGGFLLACAIIVVVFVADNTYKTDMDLQNDIDAPVLGVIPAAESCGVKSKYKYGYTAKGKE